MVDETDPLSPPTEENSAKILPPDYALKKKIGENVDMTEVFSEKVVGSAQGAIDKHKDSFRDWAIKDIAALEEYYGRAVANMESCERDIVAIEGISERMKSQAGTFDFGLATQVAKSLAKFCMRHPKPDKERMVVVRKHIDTLSVIINKNIVGDGGAVGGELMDNLAKLTEKYK